MTNKKKMDIYQIIASLVIIGAFVVMLMISLLSEFGMHPDEYDVRACLDWAMSHWIWPDMRLQGTGLGDTYSWYGYTKMSNYTVYFLVAGKVAFFFKLFMGAWPYYRVPNLLLALFMLVFTLRNIKNKKYLMVGYGVCVQTWYIFSYVTADALDFVLAFIAIYLLADEDSLLWKTVRGSSTGRLSVYANCVVLGALYGLMMLGKPYYYSIHVLTFVVLILFLCKSKKEECRGIFIRYVVILGVCILIFAARAGLDFAYYGTEKAQIKKEMMEIYAADDKKPSTPVEEQVQSYHAYDKGYPISFVFEDDPQWFLHSFRSFASARITTDGENAYFAIIGLLYMVIVGMTGYYLCKEKQKVLLVTGLLLMVGGVVASILNSYLIDQQPQGRYLLPLPLILCYLSSRTEKLWKNKVLICTVLLAGCLSVAYFGLFDMRKLVDLGYVRELISM